MGQKELLVSCQLDNGDRMQISQTARAAAAVDAFETDGRDGARENLGLP